MLKKIDNMECKHHNQNHCHECEKNKNMDFFYAIFMVAVSIFLTWAFGWSVWKYLIWPWLFIVVMYVGNYFINKSEKDKDKSKDKEKNKQK